MNNNNIEKLIKEAKLQIELLEKEIEEKQLELIQLQEIKKED